MESEFFNPHLTGGFINFNLVCDPIPFFMFHFNSHTLGMRSPTPGEFQNRRSESNSVRALPLRSR